MTGPSLTASDLQTSGGANTNTLTSSAATVSTVNGDVIVVKAQTWDSPVSMSTPSGGGLTYQATQLSAPGGFNGWSGTWTATVSGSPGSFSITSTPSGSSFHSMLVERWGSAFLDPTPAVLVTKTGAGGGLATTLTTTAANSVISWGFVDESSRDPALTTITAPASSTRVGTYDGHVGSNSVQYYVYTPVIASAGSVSIAATNSGGTLTWNATGVEIKAASGATIVDIAATFTGTGSLTAGLTREVLLASAFTGTGALTVALTRQVNLAAGFAATGSMTAGLTRQVNLAAGLTATGSMTAPLLREVPLAAALTATGTLTAGLTRQVNLAAGLTATASMSATLSTPTVNLSATFTATAGMTAVFSLPTIGPVDPIGTPVAEELMACFMQQLSTLPVPPRYVQLRVGQDTGPLIGPNIDECCAGLAWIRVANIYPSWDSFPAADNTWTPCGPFAYAVVLEMGVTFCMPWSDSDESIDNIDPPSTADWATAFNTQMVHQTLMRRTAACCFRPTQRRAVGEWTPLPVEGGCTGGKLLVTVSVPAPCGDC